MKHNQQNNYRETLISQPVNHSRREFLKKMGILGGGIIVYYTLGDTLASAAQMPFGNTPVDFNAFVRIGVCRKGRYGPGHYYIIPADSGGGARRSL
jgi:hypothetical protein